MHWNRHVPCQRAGRAAKRATNAPERPLDMASKPRTLYEKIWDDHVVETREDGTAIIYIDRHLVHEVTSPQAFEALRLAGRPVRRPELTLAVPDHNLPTTARRDASGGKIAIDDSESAAQLAALEANAPAFGIRYIGDADAEQGIVHVVGPEQGFSLPGTTIVCGDSHTASHGGLGALAFGIGTSEVEHVLATQTLLLQRSKPMEVRVEGALAPGVSAKDLILHIIGVIGAAGGSGHVIEYRGKVFEDMSVEERLTVCNMSIEAGARAGLIAPDETVFAYLKGRPMAPKGAAWDHAVAYWKTLHSDPGAEFAKSVTIDASTVAPTVTWGTSPEDVVAISGSVPSPDSFADPSKRIPAQESLDYMGLTPGQKLTDIQIDTELQLTELSPTFLQYLVRFAPYGYRNHRPIFFTRNVVSANGVKIVGNNHLKFRALQNNFAIDAIGFNLGHKIDVCTHGKSFAMVYTIEESTFNGTSMPQVRIKDLRPDSLA